MAGLIELAGERLDLRRSEVADGLLEHSLFFGEIQMHGATPVVRPEGSTEHGILQQSARSVSKPTRKKETLRARRPVNG
jgi:hypothetical protein